MTKWLMLSSILLMLSSGLSAIGEVRSCELDTAIPHSGLEFMYCTAIKGSGLEDLEGIPRTGISGLLYGFRGSKKLNPKWQISGGLYKNMHGSALEVQAKHLLLKRKSDYLSLAPSIYYSIGSSKENDYSAYADNSKCRVRGFGVPLVFTGDSHRNLLMTASAGINCDWVDTSLEYHEHPYSQDDSIVHDTFPTEFTWRGHINYGFEARRGNAVLAPEFGISWVDTHGHTIQRVINFGVKLGISPGK